MRIQTITTYIRREIPTLEVPDKDIQPPINFRTMLSLTEGKPFEGFDVEFITKMSLNDAYLALSNSPFFSNKVDRKQNYVSVQSFPATSAGGGFWFNSWLLKVSEFRTAYVGYNSNIKMNP